MPLPSTAELTRRWLTIIDHFGEDAIKAQLWHSTFAKTRQYFEARLENEPGQARQQHSQPDNPYSRLLAKTSQ